MESYIYMANIDNSTWLSPHISLTCSLVLGSKVKLEGIKNFVENLPFLYIAFSCLMSPVTFLPCDGLSQHGRSRERQFNDVYKSVSCACHHSCGPEQVAATEAVLYITNDEPPPHSLLEPGPVFARSPYQSSVSRDQCPGALIIPFWIFEMVRRVRQERWAPPIATKFAPQQ